MKLKTRRLTAALLALIGVGVWLVVNPESYETVFTRADNDGADYAAEAVSEANATVPLAAEILE